ncbi:MAG: nucleotidyltransferase domain-containing protein [Armatimonadota bacterium]|nr:nucleotidyltransferase domain-containing protein [Armatimonadota bacterium]MDW8156227.1 nucleotidyltransferase domain-containing protein [Armatimonadota bacterium]
MAERSEVQAVYLFGSLATGRAVPGSDADVLMVLQHSEERWLDRAARYEKYFAGVGLAVELFCYTAEELPSVPLARRALVEGRLLACRGTGPTHP